MQPFVHAEYVDNFIALSQERGVAHELATEVEQELNKRGLPTLWFRGLLCNQGFGQIWPNILS